MILVAVNCMDVFYSLIIYECLCPSNDFLNSMLQNVYVFTVKATCKARGDPHYSTFDGTHYDFMGRCEYVLAKDSVNNTFEIRQVNEPCGNGEPSCTKSLTVILPNVTIQLLRGSVAVNGNKYNSSAHYEGKLNSFLNKTEFDSNLLRFCC